LIDVPQERGSELSNENDTNFNRQNSEEKKGSSYLKEKEISCYVKLIEFKHAINSQNSWMMK
jgi:hypothetical protein